MDPDDDCRLDNHGMHFMLVIFPVPTMFPVPFMSRKDAAAGGKQGGDADDQDDVFHLSYCFCVSPRGLLARCDAFSLARHVPGATGLPNALPEQEL